MHDVNVKGKIRELLRFVPISIRSVLNQALCGHEEDLQEVVLRSGRPVCVYIKSKQMYLTQNGCLTCSVDSQPLVVASQKDITDCFNISCGYSVYSHLNEIRSGFLTLSGGHRIGISGTAVVSNGSIVNIRDISTISMRFAREVVGCGESIAALIFKSRDGLLLCGSPCSGKTTVLRDVARLMSEQFRSRVAVVDTRGEIGGTVDGIQQMNIGMCDVLNGYPRAEGIEQAVRVLSPQYVVCDELGSDEDIKAIISGVNSGVKFISTIHAASKEELLSRKNAVALLNTKAFENVVFLKGRESPGEISCSYEIGEIIDV
ncbi:MAG: Flp pilus assembly complex ATPase component TadA [Ruminococcus sp.]|nr:Flp pilus assembly complex ATPase component TadA [Ruminococcus sp.]